MKYGYFPGCSLHSTAVNYDQSVRTVAKALGIKLEEIPDWNCCGATSAHSTNHLLSIALPARTIAIAEKEGMDNIVAPCAACFNRLSTAVKALRGNELLARRISKSIGQSVTGKVRVVSFLGALTNDFGVDRLAGLVKRKLSGLKVAAYYGCLLTRPVDIVEFDDPENPTSMDRVVEAIGATPVDYGFKTECCGASLVISRSEIVVKLVNDILQAAKQAGADCVVTACPFCHVNLDTRQKAAETKYLTSINLPVFYFTDLVGLALGLDPHDLGIQRNIVDGFALLKKAQLG